MTTFKSVLNKTLIIMTALIFTISLIIFPLFNWGNPLKHNIAVIITMVMNKNPITSDFFNRLMKGNKIIVYSGVALLIFNLTYLLPLIFVRSPGKKVVLTIYMFIMTTCLLFFCLLIFNFFNVANFETIAIYKWWITPWIGLGLSLIIIFYYGLRQLWNNPKILPLEPLFTSENNSKFSADDEDTPTLEELKYQIKSLKMQLKEVRKIKNKH